MNHKFNYQEQADVNLSYLLADSGYAERKEVFFSIIRNFKETSVEWALLCSMNLFLTGLTDDFNDIDLLIDEESFTKAVGVIEEMGGKLVTTGGNGYCESDHYSHYRIGGVDIDLIAGFRLLTYGTSFHYPFNKEEVNIFHIDIPETDEMLNIPKVSLEALYILYAMMVGWQPIRKLKMAIIEDFLMNNPLQHPDIFIRVLQNGKLPPAIQMGIIKILKKHRNRSGT